jgi:serine/threonine-protein kinase SRPK3
MLRLHPDKRAKASDLIHHNWLEGVLVQGEIDVIRRLEMDEAAKRRGLEMEQQQQQSSSSRELSRCLDQSERDAMKPVEESVIIANGQEDEEDGEDEDEGSNRPRHQPPILAAPPAPTIMASGIARALQSNVNMSPPKQASALRSAGSKKRT